MSHRVVFMGTPEFSVPCLEALVRAEYDVVGVVTQPDKPQGRGRQLAPPPVKSAALAHGIPVSQPEKLRTPEAWQAIAGWRPDFLVVVAYGKLLGPRYLDLPKIAPINVHASLLPRYRGAAPIHWAVVRGEAQSGVAIMRMAEELDAGPVFAMAPEPILPGDTAGSLHDRLSTLGASLLVETLPRIASGDLSPNEQDHASATYAPTLSKADGALSFDLPARVVADRARGMSPWPGAFCRFKGKLIKLHDVSATETLDSGADPGTLLGLTEGTLRIACRPGILSVGSLQLEGKSRQDAADFANGARLTAGDRFESDPLVAERRD